MALSRDVVVETGRIDAVAKTAGTTLYTADIELAGMVHAALVRGAVPHGRIKKVELEAARAMPGVLGVFGADQLPKGRYGRAVRDVPLVADGVVRYLGERLVAVVAQTRRQAEEAANAVVIDYEPLEAVYDPEKALAPGAPVIHAAPFGYLGAVVTEGDPPNLQSQLEHGDARVVDAVLATCPHVVRGRYSTPAVHQGYLEPQACVARVAEGGAVELWAANKSPHALRRQVAECLGLDAGLIAVQPVAVGGDFGGKGSPMDAPLCVALAQLVKRPVKLVLRYGEDLTATNPRHPTRIEVTLGANKDGTIMAAKVDALVDGGAYAGFKPLPTVSLHGIEDVASCYEIESLYTRSRIAYTSSVPKGHMRAPGSPQANFAFESTIDELALELGISPSEIRRRNLASAAHDSAGGPGSRPQVRNKEVLEAALAALVPLPVPAGWLHGQGMAIYERPTIGGMTSIRLSEQPDGRLLVEIPTVETGTGSHTVVRNGVAKVLGIDPGLVEVRHGATALPSDSGVGGSWTTPTLSLAFEELATAWKARGDGAREVVVETDARGKPAVTSSCVQVAQVGVDLDTGQIKVLEILTAVDVASVINEKAHQMQIDGGAVMGYGFACMEDLEIVEGQVWAANLGEWRIPSAADVPSLRTVLLRDSVGFGSLNVKSIGELSNVPTAAAIANAVANAVGARVRSLPIRPERVFEALHATRGAGQGSVG